MKQTCLCGCGQATPPRRSYVADHQKRSPKRKATLEETKRKIGNPNPSGLCMCGCGAQTVIAEETRIKSGIVRGCPMRYLKGHRPFKAREQHHSWKGGRLLNRGHVLLYLPDDPRANSRGYVPERRIVWEKATGLTQKPNDYIHHLNGDKTDNRPENLIALSKHQQLKAHARENAKRGAAARWSKARRS
jgi:hypothetical protein